MKGEVRLYDFEFSFPAERPYAVLNVATPEGVVRFSFEVSREAARAAVRGSAERKEPERAVEGEY